MGMINREFNLQTLFAPQPFARRNYSSHLYAPFSIKLNRRVYLYGHHGYDLWVHLECAREILQFNERVVPVPLAFEDGRASVLAPAAVSSHDDGVVVIHTFRHSGEAEANTDDIKNAAWKKWCDLHGLQHREWDDEQLQENPIELANMKRLLRFVSCAGYVRNVALEKSIMAELGNVRKTTFAKLVQHFPMSDPDEVQQSLARLILDHEIHSDTHLSPLSMITEVSAYHEFPPNQS